LESVFHEVLTTTKPSKLDKEDPVVAAISGLARFSAFYLHLSDELLSAGRTREAEESREKARLVLESLQTQLAGNSELLPHVYGETAVAFMKNGKPREAKEFCRKLLEQGTPKIGGACNNVAWFLATAEIPAHRDPALAIELAKKAVESDPQSGNYQNTLGVARYRAGDWKQAVSDLEKSISLGNSTSFNFFFLAMAHWQLGNKEDARQSYEQAISRTNRGNEELLRFQAEAEELMKLPERK
jgi:tetratricopeptide (TPR) repeat protein